MTSHGKKDPYSKLKGYFDYLMEVTPAKESDVVFSPPYLDAWGLGKNLISKRPVKALRTLRPMY